MQLLNRFKQKLISSVRRWRKDFSWWGDSLPEQGQASSLKKQRLELGFNKHKPNGESFHGDEAAPTTDLPRMNDSCREDRGTYSI